LRHLQAGCPVRRWVLKSPDHVQSLEELFAVFPDALIIQTHRDPAEVLDSSCQLTDVLYRLYGRAAKHEEIIAHECKILADGAGGAIRFRDAHPELAERFVDVKYTDLVSDPLAVLERVYHQFDLPLTHIAVERMRRLAGGRSRYPKHGLHRVRVTHPAADPARFATYCARFGISSQRPQLR
jgi:hypothetical protein